MHSDALRALAAAIDAGACPLAQQRIIARALASIERDARRAAAVKAALAHIDPQRIHGAWTNADKLLSAIARIESLNIPRRVALGVRPASEYEQALITLAECRAGRTTLARLIRAVRSAD